MYTCEACNYFTSKHNSIKQHLKTQKHLETINTSGLLLVNILICPGCNKEYKYQSGLYRHKKKCKLYDEEMSHYSLILANNQSMNQNQNQSIQLTNNVNNIVNNTINNNTTVNNIKISKIQYLNVNFGDVIDINTFIENYKNEYGLTNKQTETLLENYKNGGINSCINSLVYYLKESAIQQYKEIKGKEIAMTDIILPFILSDKYLREHFEKTINGNWDKTIAIDNIKKIVGITDEHVYKHHNTYLQLNDQHKKKLINGVLKSSDYSKLAQITSPNLYKIDYNTNVNQLTGIDDNLIEIETDEN
jgi:hypothetical protein